jgi:hypothetical protein
MDYYLRDINPRVWKRFKAQTKRRGLIIKVVIHDLVKRWTIQSEKLEKKERKLGL